MGAFASNGGDSSSYVTQQDFSFFNTLNLDFTLLTGFEIKAADALQPVFFLSHDS
jgi:hypothetical protein